MSQGSVLMEKENYSLKEVILGTRKEYRKLSDYLYVLKAITSCYNRQVKDFDYRLDIQDGVVSQILWQFKQNPRTLKGFVHYLEKAIIGFKDDPEYPISMDLDDDVNLVINKKYDVYVEEELGPYFEQIVNLILSSNFSNLIDFGFKKSTQLNGSMYISPGLISFNCMQDGCETSLNYYAASDSIQLQSGYKDVLDINLLKEMFNKQIPAELLTPYHRGLIDGTNIKPISVYLKNDGQFSEKSRMRIKENDNSIILFES